MWDWVVPVSNNPNRCPPRPEAAAQSNDGHEKFVRLGHAHFQNLFDVLATKLDVQGAIIGRSPGRSWRLLPPYYSPPGVNFPSKHTYQQFIGLLLPATGKLSAAWAEGGWMKLVTFGALAIRGGGMRLTLIYIGVLALVFGQPNIGTAAGQAEPKVNVQIGFT